MEKKVEQKIFSPAGGIVTGEREKTMSKSNVSKWQRYVLGVLKSRHTIAPDGAYGFWKSVILESNGDLLVCTTDGYVEVGKSPGIMQSNGNDRLVETLTKHLPSPDRWAMINDK